MTTPAWMPPPLPEVIAPEPAPERSRLAGVVLVVGCILAFAAGVVGWNLRSSVAAAPETEEPLQIVDDTLADMVSGRWSEAFDRFGSGCSDFSSNELQNGFEPVLSTYASHDLNPLRRSDFVPGEIVLVFGEVDLRNQNPNPIRAEFVFTGADAEQPWHLCGLRIDES